MVAVVAMFLGWYFVYIGLSAFARDFMARPVIGNINVALVFGVLQFVSTFLLAWYYSRYSRTWLDPLSAQLRTEAEWRQAEYERAAAEHRRTQVPGQAQRIARSQGRGERRLDPQWWGEKS
ncbi:DUF485 domain-containing protein [Actinocorallia longicatena]|uniref:DUF485 domain-containing protein n=1 Tax=Actinocorallia longicatena TaxID=111803 RepID=A0ABP6PZ49_9ACTN